ncbi:protein Shroom4 isoform X2 [Erythrolamprus reginae]
MRSGDELVNINGTPLYGSRQEALILIKGSYRTLKMILRRRSVPVIRPHSWHLAKLSEVRTEGTAMTLPADPLSLSWHLGCETGNLPLPWSPLSPHCAPEKSSSLGSMDSLEPAGQTYYEGSLSPVDQAMYHSKRDSAYSSFSASSSTSDSALRPEEAGSVEGALPSQRPEPHYLQTGGEPAGSGVHLPSGVQSGSLPSPAKAAAAPPQPPLRQDSLCACNSPLEDPRPSIQAGGLCPENRWCSEVSLCAPGQDPHRPGGQLPTTGPPKDSPFTDQYYLLSSHAEPPPGMKESPQSPPSPPLAESPRDAPREKGLEMEPNNCAEPPPSWEPGWAGPFGHRHSVPEQVLVAQLQALEASRGQEGPRWTVSPLHKEKEGDLQAPEPRLNLDLGSQEPCEPAEELHGPPTAREGASSPWGTCMAPGRPQSPHRPLTGSPPLPAFGDASAPRPGFQAAPCVDRSPEAESSCPATQKGQHRSAQTRRRSDRFATNLRNEIQWRKAQLQKAKGPVGLVCGEEPAPQAEDSPAHTGAPLGEGRPLGSPALLAGAPRRWGSELSVFREEGAPGSPQRTPRDRPLPPARVGGWGGSRWHWSPEHKLQPQESEPAPPSQPPLEEPVLLPFADRRRFFEETSRPPPPRPSSSLQGGLDGTRSPEAEKPGSAEHGDFRRHSLEQSYRCPPSPPVYQDFTPEMLRWCKSLPRPGGDAEHWWALPCPCAIREACSYSFQEECAMRHPRSSHHAHRCRHPCSWSCRHECCCPGQQKLPEEGVPWPNRRPFQAELPLEEWQPPAGNRASSHTASQFLQHQVSFTRPGPFCTCCERSTPAGPPFGRAPSMQTLPWDCEQPAWVTEKAGPERGRSEHHGAPLHGRAYSESRLFTEPAGVSPREQQGAQPAQAQIAAPKSPPCQPRRRGPPPPRPPPPNWEKYHPAQGSPQPPLPAPGQPVFEAARQRSQSLPAEQPWHDGAEGQRPRLPGAAPDGAPPLPERDNPHHSCRRTWEWLVAAASDRSAPSRTASSEEGAAAEEPPPVKEQETSTGSPSEQPLTWRESLPFGAWPRVPLEGGTAGLPILCPPDATQGVPVSQEAAGESHKSGPPPSRLNSEELMRDVAGKDRSLAGVLSSGFGLRSAAEVMGDLFAGSSCPLWPRQDWSLLGRGPSCPERQQKSPQPSPGGEAPPSCLTYLNLSGGKAELLNPMEDPSALAAASSEEEPDPDLAQKKVQLIESIGRKLGVLREAQQSLQDDLSANAALGREVENYIEGACKPHELEKFRLVIGDLDKVVSLLLSLSGRLARVENALSGLSAEEEEEEKVALLEKKRQLTTQLQDAKELQEHVARREQLVFANVSRCVSPEQLQDYQHFVRMKSTLAIQQRQLDDKIKLGEEQLRCLWESLPQRPRKP